MYHLELAKDENAMPLLFEPRKQLVQEYQLSRVSYKVLLENMDSTQHRDVGVRTNDGAQFFFLIIPHISKIEITKIMCNKANIFSPGVSK